jgi:hypothetical protein
MAFNPDTKGRGHMRNAGILALVLTMGLAGNAVAQTKVFLISGTTAQSWGPYGTVGGSLDLVGKFNKNAVPAQPIAWNTSSTIEYTFYMTGMTLDSFVPGSGGSYDSSYYGAGGTISIYEGTPVNGALGTNPPNATSPSTYVDGTLILSGVVDDLKIMRRANSPGPQYVGEARGSVRFTGGSRLSELCGDANSSWTFNPALFGGTSSGTVAGYSLRWSQELLKLVCPPVANEEKTWGAIKGLYR